MDYIERNDVTPKFYTDPEYPKRLKNCIDSPSDTIIIWKGNYNFNPRHVVSIVGTRRATEYGKRLCKQLAEELQQQYNVLIASGLALGIDTYALKIFSNLFFNNFQRKKASKCDL